MNSLLSAGFVPIPYRYAANPSAGFKAMRAAVNADFTETMQISSSDGTPLVLTLAMIYKGLSVVTTINRLDQNGVVTADYADYVATMQPYANSSISFDEARFYTHDISDPSDWTSDSAGLYVSYVTGAASYKAISVTANAPAGYGSTNPYPTWGWVDGGGNVVAWLDQTLSPISGSNLSTSLRSGWAWRNAAGAILVRFDGRVSLPSATKATNNTLVTLSSCAHNYAIEPVAGNYNLVVSAGTNASTYKFTWNGIVLDNQPWTTGATLSIDGGVAGLLSFTLGAVAPVAPPQTDAVTVTIAASALATKGQWYRLDTNTIVTSSHYRITPDPGYKLAIMQAILEADQGAILQTPLVYQAWSYLPAGYAYTGSPAGMYPVKNWTYASIAIFRASANDKTDSAVALPGHATPSMVLTYDYSRTKPQLLDSGLAQYIDIYSTNDKPVTGTKGAKGTFVCLRYPSF